jgi:hypothetical protein
MRGFGGKFRSDMWGKADTRWISHALAMLMLLSGARTVLAAFPVMGDVVFANGWERATQHVGGANYLWWNLGPDCDREPYGLLPNYAVSGVRASAQQQLATMYARGMRTLSIGVYFMDGASNSGTLINAGDPIVVGMVASNLADLLDDIAGTGFERVLFRFYPQGNMNPSDGSFDSGTLPLYEDLITAMRAPLAASSLPYLVDLGAELAPADTESGLCAFQNPDKTWKCPANRKWSDATRDVWNWYRGNYGASDSVGFSFLAGTGTLRNRVRHMKYVYDDKYPGAWPSRLAIDVYGEPSRDAADQLVYFMDLANHYSASYGYVLDSFIISETWHDDPLTAARLASVIAATRQPVDYLTEWPLDRDASCEHVSVEPPYLFGAYLDYGF